MQKEPKPKWRGLKFLALSWLFLASGSAISANLVEPCSFNLLGAGTTGPYQLQHSFLIPESLKIADALGKPLEPSEFEFFPISSTIFFKSVVPVGESLLVSYSYFNTGLKKLYTNLEIPSFNQIPSESLPPALSQLPIPVSPPAKALEKSARPSSVILQGNKSFTLQAGNRGDPEFRQGLDLSISGEVSPGVRVAGYLSDRGDFQNTSGVTQRLEELDQLKIEITSARFNGSLGDQEIEYSQSRLTGFRRSLRGVNTQASISHINLQSTLASPRGSFHTNFISGQDGKQGPYFLSGPSGQEKIAIVSSSERVWLDGELLSRGSEADYTIDYLNGSLEFSPRRLVTSQSRIRMDFEYSNQSYSRSFVASRAKRFLSGGKLKIGGTFISEGDKRSNPLGFALNSSEQQILSSAGDAPILASSSGVVWKGEKQGNYIVQTDSSGKTFYKYAGEGQGDFDVSFTYQGEAKGEYVYQGAGVFVYSGPGKGNYSTLVNLPLPRNHQLLGWDLAFAPNANWDINLEVAQSNLDQNTFSSLDDRDNRGWGMDSRLAFSQKDLNLLGKNVKELSAQANLFWQDQNFRPLSRVSEVDAELSWNLSTSQLSGRQLKWQFSPVLNLATNLSASAFVGELRTRSGEKSSRQSWSLLLPSLSQGSFNFNWARSFATLSSQADSLSRSGSSRQTFRTNWNQPAWHWALKAGYSREEKKASSSGQRWKKVELGLGSRTTSRLAYQLDWSRNTQSQLSTGWQNFATTHTYRTRGAMREWKKSLNANWEYTHSLINYHQSTSAAISQNLALLKIDYSSVRGFLNLEASYWLNQGGISLKSYNYVQVPEGKGEYRLENGEYIPDPQGNYQLLIEESGQFESTLRGEKSFHLFLDPGRLWNLSAGRTGGKDFFSWLRSDTYFRLQSQVPAGGQVSLGYLLPWQNLDSDSAYFDNYSWQQEVKISPTAIGHYLALNWQKETSRQARYLSTSQKRDFSQFSSALFLRLGKSNLLELKHSQRQRLEEETSFLAHQITGREESFNFTKRLSNSSQYNFSGKLLSEEDLWQNATSQALNFSSGLSYSPRAGFRLRARGGYWKVKTSTATLSWLLAEGRKPGDNFDWDFGLDFKLGERLNYSASYRGNLLAKTKPLHFLRLDLVASL